MPQDSIQFRPISPKDRSFLYQVFASTRPDVEMSNLGEQEKQEFLEMQFKAQHKHYHTYFAGADFLIVLSGQAKLGRLYVHRSADEIHVLDIAFLPEHRGKGIGTKLMADLLTEGQRTGKFVTIYVEPLNRALSFYQRLGFVHTRDEGSHYYMEWSPSGNLTG